MIIGAGVRNGDFEEDTSTTDSRTYAETPIWENFGTSGLGQEDTATRLNLAFNGTRNLLVSTGDHRIGGQNTKHIVSAGETLAFSLQWRDAYIWGADDQIEVQLFTTSDNTVTGERAVIGTFRASETVDLTYELFEGSALASAVHAGRELFFQIGGIGESGFSRVDNVELTGTLAPDPSLFVMEGDYVFGELVHLEATDSTSKTMRFINYGAENGLLLDGISLSDDADGHYSIVSAPAAGTEIAPGASFEVEVALTGGGGYENYEGELVIDTADDSLNLTLPLSASVVTTGDPFYIVENCFFEEGTSSWGGGEATSGLASASGIRVRGVGDASDVEAESVGQVFSIGNSPDFNLSVTFAVGDIEEVSGLAPDAAYNDRSFHLLVYGNEVGVNGAVNDSKNASAIIDLFYFPAGNEDSSEEGFYLYDGVSESFVHLPGLGTIEPSTGLNEDGSPPLNVHYYQLTIAGEGFGTASASYDLSISQANDTTVAATVEDLNLYHGLNPIAATARAVVLTTNDDVAASVTNAGASPGANQTSFWVDELCVSTGATIPFALTQVSEPLPASHHLLTGTREELAFTLGNVGFAKDLTIESLDPGDPSLSLLSPSLPVTMAPGEALEFTLAVDASLETATRTNEVSLTWASNDDSAPVGSLSFNLQILAPEGIMLVDYDDGLNNGIHEASLRNGGFEDDPAGTTFGEASFWTPRFAEAVDEVLVSDADPATGSVHGVISGFQGEGNRAHPANIFTLSDWIIRPGDQFEVTVDWKPGVNFVEGDQLQVAVEVFSPDGTGLLYDATDPTGVASRVMSSRFLPTGETGYQSVTALSARVSETSGWIGGRPVLRFLTGGTRDSSALIDNVSLRAFIQPIREELVITQLSLDKENEQVGLRWTDAGYTTYVIQASADLDFSEPIEVPLDGSEDSTTYPGEIEFFFDAALTSDKLFWRVAGE
ncbi:hypothetical protein [Roseibacillus ishigakijimensis]|uniref:Uncharacterized protein n=1 Tax=Roseibacillus ishigakijimensis TaxID=454146 RepID=A0A934RNK1_9BACT|nr:hypothetical protein [Roseibacillus ishigakijimensis]MBK1832676.1 hypothetical protein [Roseibacillus ishigakijimensis]